MVTNQIGLRQISYFSSRYIDLSADQLISDNFE